MATEALKRITDSFEKVKETKAQLAVVRSEGRKELNETGAHLRICVEQEIDLSAGEKDRVAKLTKIERAWADHEDKKGEVSTNKRNANADYKAAQKSLETAVVEGRQATFSSLAAGF